MKDFISLAEQSADEILALLELADELKAKQHAGEVYEPLRGKSLAMIFEKPSLRTRVTFETGIFQLGGHGIMMATRLGERETVPDVARNLERWVNGIIARTYSHQSVLELAEFANIPVINALTDKLHPCQILADAQALREHKGRLEGLKVAFVGDGNNVFASWVNFVARIPMRLTLVCPEGYEVDGEILEFARKAKCGTVDVIHDVEKGLRDADAVYTDVWASMGQERERARRAEIFAPYQVNSRLMSMAKKDALFMHCLPAHRGEEVTNDVMESRQSIVFDQAENRLHTQKAIMVQLLCNE